MATNNAFWREVVDHLPNLILVFRVDEQENAHLIFCNNNIRDELGYSAREYVLASESEGRVQQELDDLIEEVARRSHDVDEILPRPCPLTHKQGQEKHYEVDFQLFKTRQAQSQLIAVELRESERQALSKTEEDRKGEKATDQSIDEAHFFVSQSDIMQSVLETIERIERESKRHILLQGEKGTGKRTLADQIIQRQINNTDDWIRMDAGSAGQYLIRDKIGNFFSVSKNLIVRLPHIARLSRNAQELLSELLSKRDTKDLQTWIIATTRQNLEEQVRQENFNADLYYKIGFETLLIPPLRHRPEDIRAAATQYVQRAAQILNLEIEDIGKETLDKLEQQEWTGNFPQLYKVLRRSLLESEGGEFQLRLKQKQQFQLFPEQQISEDAVLSFDQMNRKYLERVLELTDGKIYGDDGAAALLDLKPTTLQSKLKRLGIK